jgi:toxin CptA
VIGALSALGALSAFSVISSEMLRSFAWPSALMAAGYGTWLARRESRRPTHQLVWPIDGTPLLDGLALQDAQVQWRGPLAFLRWRDGKGHPQHLAWWPDTLPPRSRRELRLAAASSAGTRPAASMAP